MPRTSTFPLVDRLLDGRLSETLDAWRNEGLSYFDMAVRLHDDHSIEVAPETLRRWVRLGPTRAAS